MLQLDATLDTTGVKRLRDGLNDAVFAEFAARTADEAVDTLRRDVLDAPAPPPPAPNPFYPEQLRQVTGELARRIDVIRGDAPLSAMVEFRAEHARYHQETFEIFMRDHADALTEIFTRLLQERIAELTR